MELSAGFGTLDRMASAEPSDSTTTPADAPVESSAPATLDRPEEFIPQLTPVPNADPQWVALGRRYWAWLGFDRTVASRTPTSLWAETTKPISADTGVDASRVYLVAAAGIRATLPAFPCPTCEAPVQLRSRSSLDSIAANRDVAAHCAAHDGTLQTHLARFADPTGRAALEQKRQAEVTRREQQAAQHRARQQLTHAKATFDQLRRSAAAAAYPVQLADPHDSVDWTAVGADLHTDLGVLAGLRYAPATPMPPVSTWPAPLAPNTDLEFTLLRDAYRAGLLRVHPTASPLNAFVWTATFEQAWEAAEQDPDRLTAPATDGFYPHAAAWYASQGGSLGTATDALDAHLADRVRAWLATHTGQDDLRALAADLVAAETRRYFAHQLTEYHLPDVPDNHEARLREAMLRVAGVRSLAETYCLVWQAVRSAAATTRSRPRAPLANMTAHAANLFEERAQRAVSDPDWFIKPFREDSRVPLAAITRTLFLGVLALDPMTASPRDVTAALPPATTQTLPRPATAPDTVAAPEDGKRTDPTTPDTSTRGAALRAQVARLAEQDELSVDVLSDYLTDVPAEWLAALNVDEHSATTLRRAAAALVDVLDAIEAVAGPRAAALATYAASTLLTAEVTWGADDDGKPYRELAGNLLSDLILAGLELPDDDRESDTTDPEG